VVAMFGFGYALVPLYNVYCKVTGANGKTGHMTAEQARVLDVNLAREVTVEFDTNVNGDLPWSFRAESQEMQVHPGKVTDAYFVAENKSDHAIIGQAIPSVAPGQASLYFSKTECFCFTQQTLAPHERKEMLVRFVVKPDLPEKISRMTLSYTFFPVPEPKTTAQQGEKIKDTSDKQPKI
jgi:cytochrome c oxidase assembly protein subunit 11